MGDRHGNDLERRGEATFALVGYNDRSGLVRPEDLDLFANIVSGRAFEASGADKDQRFRRQVDVLLVLGRINGHGLVAKLGHFDAKLACGDQVRAVSDTGPVAPRWCVGGGGSCDLFALGDRRRHQIGQVSQALKEVLPVGRFIPLG